MRKVVKFGGSSLANAEQFEKVGDIIRSEESRRFVEGIVEAVLLPARLVRKYCINRRSF